MICTKALRQERWCGGEGAEVEIGKIDGHQFVKFFEGPMGEAIIGLYSLYHCFLKLNGHMNHLEILLRCRLGVRALVSAFLSFFLPPPHFLHF